MSRPRPSPHPVRVLHLPGCCAALRQQDRRNAERPVSGPHSGGPRLSPLEGERLRLIERTQINSLLKEHEIAQKGIVDFNQAKKIGKMLSADALLLGTLAVVQSSMGETKSFGRTQSTYTVEVELNGRVIDVETSEVLASATVRAKAEGNESEFAGRREGNIDKPRLHEEAIQKSIAELARRISGTGAGQVACS